MKEDRRATSTFLSSLAHAFRGIGLGLRTQRNLRLHALATAVAGGLGLWLDLVAWEWCAVCLACGAVWAAELLNTAIEALANRITQDHDDFIRDVKDLAAGAVLVLCIASATLGLILFLPKLARL